MSARGRARIAVAFARQVANTPSARWCTACVEIVGATDAGLTLMGREIAGPICVSSARVAALEDLQFTMGQGPCRDAHGSGRPVHVPRLDASAEERWPSFVELARASRIGAVFAYPLLAATVSIGVMTIYQHAEGDLSAEQHEDCLDLAVVLAETMLSLQSDESAGELAPELDEAVNFRAQIYQASGVVAVQLEIEPAEALARIRAHAYSAGEPLATVAADILAHRLRLPDDRDRPEVEVHTL